MRIISRDLLLGTSRLQRRIDGEHALLERDLEVARGNTQRLRDGTARKVTSLPALAGAVAAGFLFTKVARAPRRAPRREETEPREREGNAALNATTSLAWQFVMPLLLSWVQARFAPKVAVPVEEPVHRDDFPAQQ